MTRVWYENPKIILLIVLVVLSPGITKIFQRLALFVSYGGRA